MARLVQQSKVITILMSANPIHLAQNLAPVEIRVSPEEMVRLE